MTKKKKNKKKTTTFTKVFCGIYAIITFVFLIQVYMFDKLPIQIYAIGAGVILGITLLLILLQLSKNVSKLNKIFGKILIVVLSAFLIAGNVFIYQADHTLGQMTDDKSDKIEISIVVLKDKKIENIENLKNKTIGKISIGEQEFVKETWNSMKKEVGQMSQLEYDSFIDFGNALYNGNVDAIILDEALRGLFEENHADFNEKTKVIKTYSYEKENVSSTVEVKDVTSDTFTVYITGIDQRGTLGTRGRSDVNKIMTVNPKTHEILLVDIPRDYYIPQVCQANQKDKLTHTGIFGPDCTVSSVSNFFGVDINYYVKVNFSSFEKIIDALGGITVYSRYTFSVNGYNFYANQPNYMDGKAALTFSRERYSLPGGDNDRIKNQSLVLAAMIDKVTSPAIITNYMGFMNSISGTFITNMNESEINDLIKMQLNDMRGWNITSFAVNGTGATDWTPANGFNAYVSYPNMDSVNEAVEKMKQIKDGVILSAQ